MSINYLEDEIERLVKTLPDTQQAQNADNGDNGNKGMGPVKLSLIEIVKRKEEIEKIVNDYF